MANDVELEHEEARGFLRGVTRHQPAPTLTILASLVSCWSGAATPVPSGPEYRQRSFSSWVTIPGGNYTIGCDDAILCAGNPTRHVRIEAFRIDRTQVTESSYRECVNAGACVSRSRGSRWTEHAADPDEVADVELSGAEQVCAWRRGRLPTAAEWESAGRGPKGFLYPWGNEWDRKAHLCRPRSRRYADIVADYPIAGARPDLRSPFGVEDLSCNGLQFVRGADDATFRCVYEMPTKK